MDLEKRDRLEASGWRVGSADEFLDLCEQEAASIELQLLLERERSRREGPSGDDPAE